MLEIFKGHNLDPGHTADLVRVTKRYVFASVAD